MRTISTSRFLSLGARGAWSSALANLGRLWCFVVMSSIWVSPPFSFRCFSSLRITFNFFSVANPFCSILLLAGFRTPFYVRPRVSPRDFPSRRSLSFPPFSAPPYVSTVFYSFKSRCSPGLFPNFQPSSQDAPRRPRSWLPSLISPPLETFQCFWRFFRSLRFTGVFSMGPFGFVPLPTLVWSTFFSPSLFW